MRMCICMCMYICMIIVGHLGACISQLADAEALLEPRNREAYTHQVLERFDIRDTSIGPLLLEL